MKLKWFHILSISLIIIFCAATPYIISPPTNKDAPSGNLPTIHISLKDTTLETILNNSKEIKYPENSLSVTTDYGSLYFNDVEIKGRGNSTWNLPKSPFQIKFSHKINLFDLGKSKTYILLANFLDKSNLRNELAFYLEHMLEMDYALNGQFVELYIDDNYLGLYYLTEKIEIGKERLNLKDDYSLIVELENLHANTEPCNAITKEQTCLIVKDSRIKDFESSALNAFYKKFNELEQAAKTGDYTTVQKLADVDSFAKYFLLSDFTVNPDAYVSSFYFYQDGKDDKIHAGPGWDFDLALSNRVWTWARTKDFYLPETTRVLEKYAFGGKVLDESTNAYVNLTPDKTISRLIFWLYQIPAFQQRVGQIYRTQMMGKKEELLSFVRVQSLAIRDAAIKDREYWNDANNIIYDKFNSPVLAETFDEDIEYLLDWLSRRFNYFDYEYGGMKYLPTTTLSI